MERFLRGDIVVANFGFVKGSEQRGIRPALIIQNDFGNKYITTTIVAPLTANIMKRKYLTNVFVSKEDSKLKKDSMVLLNQIRTIDKQRIVRKVSSLNSGLMRKVDSAIKVSLDLD